MLPAKDGWWSLPAQPGNNYHDNRTEPYGALHAAVASMSRGPVSPADAIGFSNRSQIMRTCMSDGTLLSPDIPATALDSQLLKMALADKVDGPAGGTGGGVWATFTAIGHSGELQYDHVLVPLLEKAYTLTAEELWRHNAGRHGSNVHRHPSAAAAAAAHSDSASAGQRRFVVVENGAGGARLHAGAELFGADMPIMIAKTSRADFALYHTTPLLGNGWGFVGEMDKFVPVSSARVKTISSTETSIKVLLSGAPKEEVTLTFVNGNAPHVGDAGGKIPLVTVKCTFGEAGILRATPEGCSSEAYIH